MNVFNFLRLLRMIYGHRPPDLDWIQDQGLLAVKIAQHYALRVDFLDEGVCRELSRLYRDARPAPGADLRELLAGTVPVDWHDRFARLENEPFATASVGQVHHATLVDGREVVVKVLKAEHAQAFMRDLRSLRRLVGGALRFLPHLKRVFDPEQVLDHIEQYTVSELDLRNEIAGAGILAAVAEAYADRYDVARLRLPEHHQDLSGRRVLVAEHVAGETVDERLGAETLAYDDLLALFDLHGMFLFGAGVFHGDLHPGNVIVAADDDRFTLIDTGAISRSGERIRHGLFDFFVGLAGRDLDTCMTALAGMSTVRLTGPRQEAFAGRFRELYADFFGRSVAEVSLTRQMMRTIRTAVEGGMAFDQGMFPVIKSLMYLDGMVLRCRPEAVLLEDMRPFIDGFERLRADPVPLPARKT